MGLNIFIVSTDFIFIDIWTYYTESNPQQMQTAVGPGKLWSWIYFNHLNIWSLFLNFNIIDFIDVDELRNSQGHTHKSKANMLQQNHSQELHTCSYGSESSFTPASIWNLRIFYLWYNLFYLWYNLPH